MSRIDKLIQEAKVFFKNCDVSSVEDDDNTDLLQISSYDADLAKIAEFGQINHLPLGMAYHEDDKIFCELIVKK